jgi:hypothetical protein
MVFIFSQINLHALYVFWDYTFINDISGPGQLSQYSDSLRAGQTSDRITVGARFSAPVQTGPGAHPASNIMGTGSFSGLDQPRSGIDHLPPFSAEVEERVERYICSPSGPTWPVLGWTLPLPLMVFHDILVWKRHFTLNMDSSVHCSVTCNGSVGPN